ncbi:MAG: hypothetical protein MJ162_01530 [Treponema sp.]|nr:hypothetical protein [Treponema sp.]
MTTPMIITIAAVAVFLILLLICSYLKASPDEALIISGLKRKPKVIIGKAGLRIPFFEKKDRLNLKLIPIDVKTSSAVPTADYINIMVDAVVNVKISIAPEKITLAAQNFLNKDTQYIGSVAREVLEGNMREIVGRMTLEEMVSDRQKFAELVKENASPDLAAMGLDIISFNVQNFIDNNKVIEDLGVDNIVKIRKKAAISKAESERDIAKAQAEAQKEANDARVEADTQIAIKQNALDLKKAELDANAATEKAKADAAYDIQKETQRKTLEVTTADANIARQEKEILLKQKEVEVTEQKLEAEIKKQAEAEKFAALQKADADLYERQKEAEAKRFEQEQAALAVQAQAEAKRYEQEQEALAVEKMAEAQKQKMIAEAEGIKAKGEAEAAAIQAKALAEAEGTLKKAEAMKQYGDAARQQMELETLKVYFEQLPLIAKAVAEPLQKIDSITMYGEGNTAKLTEDITKTINQVSNGLKDSMGIDLQTVLGSFLGNKLASKTDDKKDSE